MLFIPVGVGVGVGVCVCVCVCVAAGVQGEYWMGGAASA